VAVPASAPKSEAPVPAVAKVEPTPAAKVEPAPVAKAAPAPVAKAEPVAKAAPAPAAKAEPTPVTMGDAPKPPASVKPAAAPAKSVPPPAKAAPAAAPAKSVPPPAKAAPAKSVPPPAKAAAAPAKAAPVPAPTKPAVPVAAAKPAAPKKRLTGEDLLAELFEAFGDLHFVRDSLEGAEFVLNLTLEKLPAEAGLVSLFDMNTREFVVVRQKGGAKSALCARQPEKAPLAFSAMRKRHAIVIDDAAGAEGAMDDRWRTAGVQLKSIVCAPIELSGRYLGLIELANPTDGQVFNEGDGNALTYIGQQFAEFVAQRGVIVDPAHIRGEEKHETPAPPQSNPKSGPKSVKKGR
jgi:hypothetical protein